MSNVFIKTNANQSKGYDSSAAQQYQQHYPEKVQQPQQPQLHNPPSRYETPMSPIQSSAQTHCTSSSVSQETPIQESGKTNYGKGRSRALRVMVGLVLICVALLFAGAIFLPPGTSSYVNGELLHNGELVSDPMQGALIIAVMIASFALFPLVVAIIVLKLYGFAKGAATAAKTFSQVVAPESGLTPGGSFKERGVFSLVDYQPLVVVFHDDADIANISPPNVNEFEKSHIFEAMIRSAPNSICPGAYIAFEKLNGYPSGIAVYVEEVLWDADGNAWIQATNTKPDKIFKNIAGLNVS